MSAPQLPTPAAPVLEYAAPAPGTIEIRALLRNLSMLIALVLIWAFFGIANPHFLGPLNLSRLAVELSITTVLALGMLLIILPGHIDLSIGSGVGLFAGLVAMLISEKGWSAPAAMLVSALCAVTIWALMGTLIIKERIPSFIMTLAGLLIFRGLHLKVIHFSTINLAVGGHENAVSILTSYNLPRLAGWTLAGGIWLVMLLFGLAGRRRRLSAGLTVSPGDIFGLVLFVAALLLVLVVLVCNQHQGVPLAFLILAITAAIIWVITQHTRFGRYLYAIGGNEDAAIVSGVPVAHTVIIAFAIMGLLVALGGFMWAAYVGSATTTIGQLLELDAISACVIGGASLKGGRGTVLGTLFGSLIMASLLNGMSLMAVGEDNKLLARGIVLALAVWMDVRLGRK